MKKNLIYVLLLFINVINFAQTATKPTPKTTITTSTITIQDANAFIEYTNAVGDFFQQQGNDDYIYDFIDDSRNYANSLSIYTNKFLSSYKDFKAIVKDFTAYKKINPTIPPQKIKKEIINNISKSFILYDSLHYNNLSLVNKLNTFVGDYNKINKKDLSAIDLLFKNITDNYNTMQQCKKKIQNECFNIGLQAEEVTLAKHPLKNELLDAKKSLSIMRNILELADVETFQNYKNNKPEIDSSLSKLNTLQSKYLTNYNTTSTSGRIEIVKTAVKNYFEEINYFKKSLDYHNNYENKIITNKTYTYENSLQGLINAYEQCISRYNTIVNYNNE